jgi:8-oxo-dGTP pyrophosphatase MutT (NUDIX family)
MVLLVRRSSDGLLAGGGGFMDKTDPDLAYTAVRELREETRFQLTGEPERVVHSGYVYNRNEGDPCWIEGWTGLWLVSYREAMSQPLVAQLSEVRDCRWHVLSELTSAHMSRGHEPFIGQIKLYLGV